MHATANPDFAAKRRLYKTAQIVSTGDFVSLIHFAPASEWYEYADFWIVSDRTGGREFSIFESELQNFCL